MDELPKGGELQSSELLFADHLATLMPEGLAVTEANALNPSVGWMRRSIKRWYCDFSAEARTPATSASFGAAQFHFRPDPLSAERGYLVRAKVLLFVTSVAIGLVPGGAASAEEDLASLIDRPASTTDHFQTTDYLQWPVWLRLKIDRTIASTQRVALLG